MKNYTKIAGSVAVLAAVLGVSAPAEAYWGWHGGYVVAPAPYYPPPYRYYYEPAPVYVVPPPQPVATRLVCRDYYNPAPTIIGGVAGGLVGSTVGRGNGRIGAIVGGTLIGGLLGSQYTMPDRYCTREVFETAPVGAPYAWVNPNNNVAYTVTPERDYNQNGMYCREYQATADINGRPRQTYGTACRQPDGSWKIMN